MFRALPVSVILCFYKDNRRSKAVPILCSAILFSLAHIHWSIFPIDVQINWFQLVYAFLLGLVYAVTFIKSKSIIYPIIMHSISNVYMVGIGYLFMAFS